VSALLKDKTVSTLLGMSLDTLRQGRVRSNLRVPKHIKHANGRVFYTVDGVRDFALAHGLELRGPLQRKEEGNG
jgi:hypothetical protein